MRGVADPPGRRVRTDFDKRGNVVSSTHSGNTVNNTGGTAGQSVTQSPIPGPVSPGQPISRVRALARKTGSSVTGGGPGLPNRNTSAAGSVR